ncbi:MAG TPA: RimK-like ATPgrasp N-terminal domain-containing protein [Trueperaceae bacterium]|nr:RimK-like ATPgrasp N-terminal domain-containing protein [Trueperaceae bacterium]
MSPESAPVMFHLDRARFGPDGPGRGAVQADVANLAGDYTYLTSGYYASLDAELAGLTVLPTTAEALDAYVVPLAMAKAAAAGLPVPEHELITDRFPPAPLLGYPVNPFSSKGELLLDEAAIEARRKGLTYTGKYAVLVQHLPRDHRIDVLRLVLGMSVVPEYEDLAAQLFAVFRLPLMKVRIVVTTRNYELSAIEPLPFGELSRDERGKLEGLGTWHG